MVVRVTIVVSLDARGTGLVRVAASLPVAHDVCSLSLILQMVATRTDTIYGEISRE